MGYVIMFFPSIYIIISLGPDQCFPLYYRLLGPNWLEGGGERATQKPRSINKCLCYVFSSGYCTLDYNAPQIRLLNTLNHN